MKFILSILLLLMFSACDVEHEEVAPPPKPETVPEGAFWVGGPEGGVFVSVSKGRDNKTYFGTIYFEANGEIWYQGEFKYTGETSFNVSDRSSYTGWDGDYLFLKNGEKLVAVDSSR